MANYMYKTSDGNIHEVTMSFSEHALRDREGVIVLNDGREAKRDFCAEGEVRSHRASGAGWPLKIFMDGIPPGRAKEENAKLAAKGVAPVEVTAKGDYYVTSPTHMRQVFAARGRFNMDDTHSPRNA